MCQRIFDSFRMMATSSNHRYSKQPFRTDPREFTRQLEIFTVPKYKCDQATFSRYIISDSVSLPSNPAQRPFDTNFVSVESLFRLGRFEHWISHPVSYGIPLETSPSTFPFRVHPARSRKITASSSQDGTCSCARGSNSCSASPGGRGGGGE